MIQNTAGHMRLKKIISTGILFLLVLGGLFAAERDAAATRRFGIFIGSNNGGRDRIMLRYAVSDAKSLSRVFAGMGGIAEEDSILLVEPTVREINRQLDNLGRLSAQARRNTQRTELVFYYSGHSDEDGILLNRERYGYRELRDRINAVQMDMKIVILDSCSSGAITRAKGGVKAQPFLFDSSVSAEGYAFLTSSSADESSQESDRIESSYFTHSLLAGLRGAADSVGDGRVTLNELYRFAYTETLAKTETSIYGPQHPSYDIQISGSGDVVLTDIKEISASLLISEDLTGRISIRDNSDFLVAELTKVTRKPMELGLEPGVYRITLQQGDNFYRVEVELPENQRISLGMENFSLIAAASGDRRRGDGTDGDVQTAAPLPPPLDEYGSGEPVDEVPHYPASIQYLPALDVFGHNGQKATNNFLFGLIVAKGHNINGLGAASIGIINTGYTRGAQGSGIFNITEGTVTGAQGAGIFNMVNDEFKGAQAAGIFNIVNGPFTGAQGAGIFNLVNGNITGAQGAGIFNITNGNFHGIQASGIFNLAGELRGLQASLVNINEGGNGAMLGLVNVSKSEDMVPVGLVNIIENGLIHAAVYIDDMRFTNVSFRSGSRYFYTFLSAGTSWDLLLDRDKDKLLIARAGFGFEIPINQFFINIDVSGGSITNLSTVDYTPDRSKPRDKWYEESDDYTTSIAQLRLSGGYKIYEHLGVFAGLSYDYLFQPKKGASPGVRDFGGPMAGKVYGRHAHKLGFFGGLQF